MATVVFLLYKMGINPDDLNLLIEQAMQKVLNQSDHNQLLLKYEQT